NVITRRIPLAAGPTATGPMRRQAPAEGIARLRDMFAQARRPVLLLGQGALGEREAIATLAGLAIPVVTTPTARGILSEGHPLAMGFDSLRGHVDVVNEL